MGTSRRKLTARLGRCRYSDAFSAGLWLVAHSNSRFLVVGLVLDCSRKSTTGFLIEVAYTVLDRVELCRTI